MNYTGYTATQAVRSFVYKAYGWMAVGLTLTAATAYYLFMNKALFAAIFKTPMVPLVLFLAQLGLVIALAGFVMRMSMATAALVFLGYSILTGVTLSGIFYLYNIGTIYTAFAVAAGMFSSMALYGYFTNDDLTSIGSLARMGLFGIIIALLINLFVGSSQFDYLISLVGVAVFTLLTAYDSQKIKQLGHMMLGQGEVANKVALVGALTLYLDFINLFLFILKLFGRSRED